MAPAPATGSSEGRAAGASAPTSISTCSQVAVVENMAPAWQAASRAGSARACVPSEAMVAVLETKPENSPDSASPARAPNRRSATWPAP